MVYWFFSPDVAFLSRLMATTVPPYLYWMAACETAFALRARSFFSPGQTLRFAWGWFAAAGLLRLIGFLMSYVLGFPLTGRLVSGLFAGLLTLLGLFRVSATLRAANLQASLRLPDRVILAVLWLYVLHHFSLVVPEVVRDGLISPIRNALWLVAPMLLVLTWQALLIRRSMKALGDGRLAHCWGALAASTLFIVVGNIGQLAQPLLHLSAGPWLLLDCLWILPYPFAALAPALQVEASALALDSSALRALDQKNS